MTTETKYGEKSSVKKRTFDDDVVTQLEESLTDLKEGRVYEFQCITEPKTGTVRIVKKRAQW